MKKNISLILLGLLALSLNYSSTISLNSRENDGQPQPVVIIINLPGIPQRPVSPPNSPKPTRFTVLPDQELLEIVR